MIMMADREKKAVDLLGRLRYSTKENDYLSRIILPSRQSHSRGVAVLTFKEQTPFFIDDVSQI